jgi:hypothetical protein
MPASGWMRKLKGTRCADERVNTLARALARGDSLDKLLDLGVQALLEAAVGDRAGLWLASNRHRESGRGRVVEAVPGPIPEQWKHLDITTPFLRAALERAEPFYVQLGPGQSAPHVGPLLGMRSAIWIPIRV